MTKTVGTLRKGCNNPPPEIKRWLNGLVTDFNSLPILIGEEEVNSHLQEINKTSEAKLIKDLVLLKLPPMRDTENVEASVVEEDNGAYYFSVTIKGIYNAVVSFRLMEMPGCCGVVISFNSNVVYSHRKKGIGAMLSRYRTNLCKRLGYTIIIATDQRKNKAQRKILSQNKWRTAFSFVNQRTENNLNFSYRQLRFNNKLAELVWNSGFRIPKEERRIYHLHGIQ